MSDTIHLDQELSEYLDGDLDARARAEVETHLRDCAECTALLDELRAVSVRAHALEPAPPAADLWPGIAARLDRRRGAILPLPTWLKGGGVERWSFTLPQLAAAALVIALISGGSVWWALRSGAPTRNGAGTQLAQRTTTPSPSPVSGATNPLAPDYVAPGATSAASPARPGGTPDVTTAEFKMRRYDEAVTELQQALAQNRAKLDPQTVKTVEENLMVIDAAIDRAKRALAADPSNAYLSGHLAEQMQLKIRVLQRAADAVAVNEAGS